MKLEISTTSHAEVEEVLQEEQEEEAEATSLKSIITIMSKKL